MMKFCEAFIKVCLPHRVTKDTS